MTTEKEDEELFGRLRNMKYMGSEEYYNLACDAIGHIRRMRTEIAEANARAERAGGMEE